VLISEQVEEMKQNSWDYRTTSLCSLRLTMTAVICWSRKTRMVANSAGTIATRTNHQWVTAAGLINQPLYHPQSSLSSLL